MKLKGVMNGCVLEMFPVEDLKEGLDFEVVSYSVLDFDYDYYSANRYFEVSDYEEAPAELVNKGQESGFFCAKTPFNEEEMIGKYFYKMKGPIHFDYAVSCGFGVVRFLRGEREGDYALYHYGIVPEPDDAEDFALCMIDVMVMLKIYVQLTYADEVDDWRLEKWLLKEGEYYSYMFFGGAERIYERLNEIYQSKKGRLVPFNNRQRAVNRKV